MSGTLQEVRVIPHYDRFVVEVVWKVDPPQSVPRDTDRYLAIDLGIVNLATIVTNIVGLTPILIRGGPIKALNQFYNKLNAQYYAILRRGYVPKEGPHTSHRLQRLAEKRRDQIKDAFYKISRSIVNYAVEHDVSQIIIGHNTAWKQGSALGRRNNQNFVYLPHALLIEMIRYKAQTVGIAVIVTEESYTSQASALDEDEIPTYGAIQGDHKPQFSGKRVKRGLYVTQDGTRINADVNGAMNILRKVFPNAFAKGIVGRVKAPLVAQFDPRNSHLHGIA